MWISKSGQNDLKKRDLGLWSNLQGVTFPAAGAEPRERWTNSRGTDGIYLVFDEGI